MHTLHTHRPESGLTTALLLGALGLVFVFAARPALAEEAGKLDVKAAESGGDATYKGGQPIDQELDKYWNVEQKVQTLQNPMYERKGGFEGVLHFGVVPNDSFYLPLAMGGKLAYFITDTLSVEGTFSYLKNSDSVLRAFLVHVKNGNQGYADLTSGSKKAPKMNYLSALDVTWSPFHGKIGIFASKLSNFDLGVVAGLGMINADIDEGSDGDSLPAAKNKFGGHWGATLRFFLTRWLSVRWDYRQYVYFPDKDKPFLAPVEFTGGLAFLTK